MKINNNNISGTIYFDHEDKIYRDHFPGNPIVPGSVIVNALLKILKEKKIELNKVNISRFKFKHFVKPGEYTYCLEKSDNSYKFSLNSSDKNLVTGKIICS
jgi:3-hydroxyacyl-[acyl-carrier-protein] dehydratase